MRTVLYFQKRDTMPAATPERSLTCPLKSFRYDFRCAKAPVVTRSTRKPNGQFPKLVPERAQTSPNVYVLCIIHGLCDKSRCPCGLMRSLRETSDLLKSISEYK
eukprot:6187443-Pleurochrysis_carterae.AAC.1